MKYFRFLTQFYSRILIDSLSMYHTLEIAHSTCTIPRKVHTFHEPHPGKQALSQHHALESEHFPEHGIGEGRFGESDWSEILKSQQNWEKTVVISLSHIRPSVISRSFTLVLQSYWTKCH